MFTFCRLSLALILFIGVWEFSSCYSLLPRPFVKNANGNHLSTTSLCTKSHSEYSVLSGDDDLNEKDSIITREESNDVVIAVNADTKETEDKGARQRPEYGALSPGTVVQVQVGDLALARKAWKKRRRTGSPLLVPCSVLNVDRQSMVRWNLIFLLEKFGHSRKDGIEITDADLSKKYRSYLKSSLQKQADALGYDSAPEMIVALFNKKTQDSYGVRLVEKYGQVSLKAPISRSKAQKLASAASLLQFRPHRNGEHGDADTLTHTGYVHTKKQDTDDNDYHFLPLSAALRVSQKDDVDTGRVEEKSIHPAVVFDYDVAGDGGSPLLTLSLNPRGVRETLKVKPDRKYMPIDNPHHMFHDLSVGDGPFRAKVVRLMPGKALVDLEVGRKVSTGGMVKVLGALRFQDSVELAEDVKEIDQYFYFDDDDIEDDIEDVIGAAFDDLDEEDDEEDDGPGMVEDLLSLRADSSFEEGTFEEGEEEEDISDQFEMNDDGALTYTDPETGETMVLDTDDYEEEEEEEEEDTIEEDNDEPIYNIFENNDDGILSYTDPQTGETMVLDTDDDDYETMLLVQEQIDSHFASLNEATGSQKRQEPRQEKHAKPSKPAMISKSLPSNPKFVSKRLRVGDNIDVYIRSTSKQSSQFTVTTNPLVQGRKAKDIKKEGETQKKLKRLEKSLGGSLRRIWELEGQECDGTVKATSKTGDWVYVQPELNGLPVGVATSTEDISSYAPGDSVRVRIAGVDEERGQLAMQLVGKFP